MSDTLVDASFDEEQYADDSFETEVPEPSLYGSENDNDMDQQNKQQNTKKTGLNEKASPFVRNGDFMTCESSSDEDDVILGETIAEINTDVYDYDEDENISLTPAERVFQMASETRRLQTMFSGMPTPPNSKENISDVEDDEEYDLSECEDFDEQINGLECENADTEEIFQKYTKLTTEDEFIYEEEQIIYGSEMELEEEYCDVSIEDGGEIDVGEPNIGEELGEEEEENDEELIDKVTDEDEDEDIEKHSVSSKSENGEMDVMASSSSKANEVKPADATEDVESERKSLNANDSMESFKRRVMLSQRMRCQSEGAGDGAHMRIRPIKSNIPVWTGPSKLYPWLERGKDISASASMIRIIKAKVNRASRTMSHDTLENSKVQPDGKSRNIDVAAGGDNNETMNTTDSCTDCGSSCDGNMCAYSLEMEKFMKAGKAAKPPKKLKAGERRNKSFSNDRLRDIERHNHILLRKIINQKPTYDFSDKKKKTDKFASLPPTTRLSSAAVNRKKQERQIAMDNVLFKRKLDAILQRKPKPKAKAK